MPTKILVIDDEEDIRNLIQDILEDANYKVYLAANSKEAIETTDNIIPNAILLDIWLEGSAIDGLKILELLIKNHPLIPIIMISGHGNIETAVKAMKLGAYDYLQKPFTEENLLFTLNRACEKNKLILENQTYKNNLKEKFELIGDSFAVQKVKNIINKTSSSLSRVFISGAPGVGKTLVAKTLHQSSAKANSPFYIFDPTYDIKNHNEHFFDITNTAHKESVVTKVQDGTLFIKNIEHLTSETQGKLLKFIYNNQQLPAEQAIRIITSSTLSAQEIINSKKLREDLFFRLSVVNIELPKLSDRKSDIPLLIDFFLNKLQTNPNKFEQVNNYALSILQTYSWPGNVRQLKNLIEWLVTMYAKDNTLTEISSSMLPKEITDPVDIYDDEYFKKMLLLPIREAREDFENKYLRFQLSRFNNNISNLAKEIGMDRSALHRKLKSLNLVE
jgi:two-component system nitrogen regulation response regulator NtrX